MSVGFLANQFYFLFILYLLSYYYLLFFLSKKVRMRAHTAYLHQITKQMEKNAMVSRNKNSDKITESRNAKSYRKQKQ